MHQAGSPLKTTGLTYNEAIEAIKADRLLKLPEWGGFWFNVQGNIWVFTKEKDIINTPWLDKYIHETTWEIVTDPEQINAFGKNFFQALRLHMDDSLNYMKRALPVNREVSLARTSLQTSFMFLGKVLGQLGSLYPYPQSYTPSSPVIEKAKDVVANEVNDLSNKHFTTDLNIPAGPGDYADLSPTAKTKALRAEISHFNDLIWAGVCMFGIPPNPGNYYAYTAMEKLTEAIMWLGQNLNNILEEQNIAQEKYQKVLKTVWAFAEYLYNSYCESADWKNFEGKPIPKWADVREDIKKHWYETALSASHFQKLFDSDKLAEFSEHGVRQ